MNENKNNDNALLLKVLVVPVIIAGALLIKGLLHSVPGLGPLVLCAIFGLALVAKAKKLTAHGEKGEDATKEEEE